MQRLAGITIAGVAALIALGSGAGGCGDDASNPDNNTGGQATGGSGAGGSAGGAGNTGGAPPGCPPGSHTEDGVCVSSLLGWENGPSLLEARDHHVTFTVSGDAGNFLYAAAGVQDGSLIDTIERATITEPGTLGAWEAAGTMPSVAGGAGIGQLNGYLVISGGRRVGFAISDAVDVTTIQADGSLGAWLEGPRMGATRFHHACVAHDDNVYCSGGLTGDGTDNVDSCERLSVTSNGPAMSWQATSDLPSRRSHHAVASYGDYLYATGGLTGNPAGAHISLDEVLRASIEADGSLGPWEMIGTLPKPLSTHASFAFADYLYVFGGIEDSVVFSNSVRRAPILEDGTIGAWEDAQALPTPRGHAHQVPFLDGYAYSVGGAYLGASIADVFIGRFL